MQQAQENDKIEMSLREHLLAAGAGQAAAPATPVQNHNGPHEHHNIDPAIAGSGGYATMTSPGSADGDMSESRKGRRELSTSKRAAQNRAAQRAFRQRKEEYIKSLKDQVKEYEQLAETYKAVQAENYQLRDYIINLQQRLIEAQGSDSVPPPPDNVDLQNRPVMPDPTPLRQLPPSPKQAQNAPTATMTPVAIDQLQQAAAQATAQEANNVKNDTGYVMASEYPQDQKDQDMEGGSGTSGDSNGA